MTSELIRDLDREQGWWLLVDGSEQSFVDLADPSHLEFEYVQMISWLIECRYDGGASLDALHLGGGLCTLPRWVAHRHPGSRQVVAERSRRIAAMARDVGGLGDIRIVVQDATTALSRRPEDSADLVVCDIYQGPETVTSLFTLEALQSCASVLRRGGLFACNLSDATPFRLARVVVATVLAVFDDVVLLVEPGVWRGRRSGNVVVGAAMQPIPERSLARRAAGGALRARVVRDAELLEFVGTAEPAVDEADLPPSGESLGRVM